LTIYSMTGYAVAKRESAAGTVTIELKSVNSRFLDLQFRINDDLRTLEPALREVIIGKLVRGKVECRLSFGRKSAEGAMQALNQSLLDTLAALQIQVRSQFNEAAPLSVNELLRWPGVRDRPRLSASRCHGYHATDLERFSGKPGARRRRLTGGAGNPY